MGYTHDFVDSTAVTLHDFADNILKLASMKCGDHTTLGLIYDKPGEEAKEVVMFAHRDVDGDYYLNEVISIDLDNAIELYSLACANLFKTVAVDEYSCDQLEEVCRTFVQEDTPESVGCDVWSDISGIDACVLAGTSTEVFESRGEEEIIEVYHVGQDAPSEPLAKPAE